MDTQTLTATIKLILTFLHLEVMKRPKHCSCAVTVCRDLAPSIVKLLLPNIYILGFLSSGPWPPPGLQKVAKKEADACEI